MSQKVKLILMGLAIVVVAVLVWFFLLSPIRSETAEVDKSIEKTKTDVTLAQTQLDQAQATRDEGKRNQARLLELAKMVPVTEELPSLILQIQDLADQAGIDFIQITPAEFVEATSGEYLIIPLALSFQGTYFDTTDFVYRAEQMVAGPGRLLAVKSIDLQVKASEEGATGPANGLEVTMNVYAFIMGGVTGPEPGSTTATTAPSTSEPDAAQ